MITGVILNDIPRKMPQNLKAIPKNISRCILNNGDIIRINAQPYTWAKVGCLTNWATQAPLFFIYFWEREREHERGRGREKAKWRIPSSLCTDNRELNAGDMGLTLTNREIMTWTEVGGSTDWATQVPFYEGILNARPRSELLLPCLPVW